MNTPMSSHNRLYYLDAVRSIALILGIIFHGCLAYIPVYIGWAVMDISTSGWVSVFALISHSFRMALFFLIAGYFSRMTFHNVGVKAFFKQRAIRLALPFLMGWILLRPLLVASWSMGADSMRGDVNVTSSLLTGIQSLNNLPENLFVGTHLWFIYYLIIISFTVIITRSFIFKLISHRSKAIQLTDNIVHWLSHSHWSFFVITPLIAACLWSMNHWGIDTPDKSLKPDLPVFFLYGGFFCIGWLLQRKAKHIEALSTISWQKCITCIVSILACVLLSSFETQFSHELYLQAKIAFLLSYASMMCSLIALMIGTCRILLHRANTVISYLSDASYWLYLIHLPIVIWLQITFAELPWHWSLKWLLVTMLTLTISLIIYDIIIRPTVIGTILNGRKKPSFLLERIKLKQVQQTIN